MRLNKLTIALLASTMAVPAFAATTAVTSFENGDSEFIYGGNGTGTYLLSSDVATDGSTSLQASLAVAYSDGVKFYNENSWNWSGQTSLVFDIVNNSDQDINYGVKVLSSYAWDDAHSLSDYFNVPANSTLEAVEFSLDSTEWGAKGDSFDKAAAMEIQFFAGSTANAVFYIDNVQVSDGVEEPAPVEPEPEPEEPASPNLVVNNFEDIAAGTVIDEGAGVSSNMVSTDYATTAGGQSWKVDFTAPWSAAVTIWGDWDMSTEGATLDMQILNDETAAVPYAVKLFTQGITDWVNGVAPYTATAYLSLEAGGNGEFQAKSIVLDTEALFDVGASFDLSQIGGIQIMSSDADGASGAATIYIDDIVVINEVEEPTPEEPTPEEPTPEEPEDEETGDSKASSGGSFGGLGALLIGGLLFFRRKFS